jgi:hypothetical protein
LGAQGIEVESPQALHRQSRGLGAESPVFLSQGIAEQSLEIKKPGFPLQVLGFAYAKPAGFPLQSLVRPRAFALRASIFNDDGK